MPRIVALDIGTYAVKATLWKSAGRQFECEAQVDERVVQNEDGQVTPDEQLQALDALIQANKEVAQGANIVAASWGGGSTSLHGITLPFTDMAQIKKTLSFAVEDEVPFDLDEMSVGWRVASQDIQTELLVALTPKDDLRGFIDALNKRGMEPRQIMVDAEVLACWSGEEPTAVIDVGHLRTLVVLAAGGKMLSSTVLDVGGWHLTRAIHTSLQCSWDEAEGVKHGSLFVDQATGEETTDPKLGSGVYGRLPAHGRAAVDEVLAQLVSGVRATLISAEDRLGLDVAQIRLGGGGSKFDGVFQSFEKELGVPVYCVVDADGQQIAESFVVAEAIAAQITGSTPADHIDLRQGDLAYRSGMNILQTVVTFGGVALAVFSVVLGGYYFWKQSQINASIAAIQQETEAIYAETLPGKKVRGPTKAMQLMRARIDESRARAAALGAGAEPPTVALINDLTAAFPKPDEVTVDVLQLTVSPKVIQFEAETTGFAEAAKVEESLQASELFQQAAKANEKKKRGKIEFTVQIPRGVVSGEEG